MKIEDERSQTVDALRPEFGSYYIADEVPVATQFAEEIPDRARETSERLVYQLDGTERCDAVTWFRAAALDKNHWLVHAVVEETGIYCGAEPSTWSNLQALFEAVANELSKSGATS